MMLPDFVALYGIRVYTNTMWRVSMGCIAELAGLAREGAKQCYIARFLRGLLAERASLLFLQLYSSHSPSVGCYF